MSQFAGLEPRYLASSDYNPRHDPDLPDILIGHPLQHYGEWVHLGQTFNADVWEVRDVIAAARRVGLVIIGDPVLGYMLIGFAGCHYVHVRKALAWPPEPEESAARERGEMVGQLRLVEAGG